MQSTRIARGDGWALKRADAALMISGIGSFRKARLRLVAKGKPDGIEGCLEILTLAGTLSGDGAHLHMSVANAEGRVTGGHVAYGCSVRTTAEVLLVLLPDWTFTRELDPNTEFREISLRSNR
jgi:predicted DNA-binding protein with PD1-like motif